jgi:hypothetical protein
MNLLKINLLKPAKTLGFGVALTSAVFLSQANSVLAAEFVGDAQMQARDLLSGTVGGRARTADQSPAIPDDGHQTSSLDPQEQARQLILGAPKMNATPAASARDDHRTNPDPQESARRMILGSGAGGTAAPVSERAASLTQDPLVMRLGRDEFRIAFGIDAGRLGSKGGNGVIRYRVDWKTEDGTRRSEIKQVNFTVPAGAGRTITVDHQYLDTAEGEHTTEVVKVSVEKIAHLDPRFSNQIDRGTFREVKFTRALT